MLDLTITSCKRFDLLEKTINSFLECCLDIDLINKVICVDDNSDKDDIVKIDNLLKKFNKPYELILKTPQQKGHQRSLNMLYDNITREKIFHLEDDWLFTVKDHFIRKSLDIMWEDSSISQVLMLINKRIMGIDQKVTVSRDGFEYIKYRFDGQYHQSHAGRPAWPGWNLNPAVWDFHHIKNCLGKFNENINNFEFNFSRSYWKKGLKVAYFPINYCHHIGDNNSSYKLNGTTK